jgi:hypothetical protein
MTKNHEEYSLNMPVSKFHRWTAIDLQTLSLTFRCEPEQSEG